VRDIKIPKYLHTYEDAYIIQHIKSKGYKVTVGSQIYCLHYKPPNGWSARTGFLQAGNEFRCGLVYMHLYRYMLFYPAFFFNWLFQVPLNFWKNYFRNQN